LLKHFNTITIIFAVLLAPTVLLAASTFAPAKAVVGENHTVTVPLVVGNADGLMAMDIPLSFSEGVTLKEVTFENTRVEYFDLKLSHIDNDAHQVIIGLINQATPEKKPFLSAGEGAVANLVFSVDDPALTEITISAATMEDPHHSLMYIYNDGEGHQHRELPDYAGTTIALSEIGGSSVVPVDYGLNQNYPNPFNPTTEISFALPQASFVTLDIYNVLGQRVNSLVNGELPAGEHTVTWNGTNDAGGSVASGVYFYRLTAGDFVQTKKMMMLK